MSGKLKAVGMSVVVFGVVSLCAVLSTCAVIYDAIEAGVDTSLRSAKDLKLMFTDGVDECRRLWNGGVR